MERTARDRSPCVRLWHPQRAALSLGRLDLTRPGVERAAGLARAAGAAPVRRLSGGRAAVVDEGCLCLGWAQPQSRLEEATGRYRLLAGVLVEAMSALGVPAVCDELEGEWCPGAWSVRGAGGKLAGLAQRSVRGAAWCEALIVIRPNHARRALAEEVHRALEIPWREDAQGAVADELPDGGDVHAALAAAIERTLARRFPDLDRAPADPRVERRARELELEHRWP